MKGGTVIRPSMGRGSRFDCYCDVREEGEKEGRKQKETQEGERREGRR